MPVTRFPVACACRALLLVALAGVIPHGARAQEAPTGFAGRVTSESSGEPLADARVTLIGTRLGAATDAAGRFRVLGVPEGPYVLQVRHLAHETVSLPVRVKAGEVLELEVSLGERTFALPDLVVSQRDLSRLGPHLAGFYDRMKANAGFATFLTPEWLNSRNPQFTSDALRQVSGVRVTCGSSRSNAGGGCQISFQRAAGNAPGAFGAGNCPPLVILDGQVLRGIGPSLDNIVPAQQIYGMEIYRGVAIPPEFNYPGASCGVLAIWTGDRFAERDRQREAERARN